MALRQDLLISQGTTWSWVYSHYDSAGSLVDLTGYSARMAIREHYETGLRAYLSSLSDGQHGSVSLGGAGGTVTFSLSATETGNLAIDLDSLMVLQSRSQGEAPLPPTEELIYDVELEDGSGNVTRAVHGKITLIREVTRA